MGLHPYLPRPEGTTLPPSVITGRTPRVKVRGFEVLTGTKVLVLSQHIINERLKVRLILVYTESRHQTFVKVGPIIDTFNLP